MSMKRYEEAVRREHVREQLASLSPGGSPRRRIEVTSASVIDGRAAATPCPQCGGEHRVLEHTRPEPGVRRVDAQCRYCGAQRTLWFTIVVDDPN